MKLMDATSSKREDVVIDNFEFIRMDAMVAELVSSSPRTYDIYGFCGVSILSEFFYHGDIEDTVIPGEHEGFAKQEDLHDEKELKPQNNLTSAEKLILSLEMAEGIAVLQGNRDGVIVHDDIQLSQFLFNRDRSILKINDFNRAEFMLWDEEKHAYCTYRNGPGQGNVRSKMLNHIFCFVLVIHFSLFFHLCSGELQRNTRTVSWMSQLTCGR